MAGRDASSAAIGHPKAYHFATGPRAKKWNPPPITSAAGAGRHERINLILSAVAHQPKTPLSPAYSEPEAVTTIPVSGPIVRIRF